MVGFRVWALGLRVFSNLRLGQVDAEVSIVGIQFLLEGKCALRGSLGRMLDSLLGRGLPRKVCDVPLDLRFRVGGLGL